MQLQDTVRIPLISRDGSVKAYAVIDASDLYLVSDTTWRWCVGYAGRAFGGPPRRVRFIHRVVLGLPDTGVCGTGDREVDHINRNRLDNRRCNLRIVSHRHNMQNKPSYTGSASQYRGVSWDSQRSLWRARVTVDGKQYRLGRFASEAEAGEIARQARLRLMPFASD